MKPSSSTPAIHEVLVKAPSVEQHGKMEARVRLEASFNNPYDYSQVSLIGIFIAPSGIEKIVDGFFMEEYQLDPSNGQLHSKESSGFRLRFSPSETGLWQFKIILRDRIGEATSESYTFFCIPKRSPTNHGFLRTGTSNYLQFDDGTSFIPIGENMAWPNGDIFLNYSKWLIRLSQHGGNCVRLWHAHWGLGIEWRKNRKFDGLRRYQQAHCFYQDWLLDHCAENGVYLIFTLQHHGAFSSAVDADWSNNPYNISQGGPCKRPVDFFTQPQANQLTKNRLRYIIARWGYARNLLGWELFNEVHWIDDFEQNMPEVFQWHAEMADFIKSIDPNHHLISSSGSNDTQDTSLWLHPSIDFTQTHIYHNSPYIQDEIVRNNHTFLKAFNKPTLNGEFGLGYCIGLNEDDPDGIHIHNALWASMFSGAFGAALSWWWDTYIHPQNLYFHFAALSKVADRIPFLEKKMKPVESGIIRITEKSVMSTASKPSELTVCLLVSEDRTTAAGWILNKAYNHRQLLTYGKPKEKQGGALVIKGLKDGDYVVTWFDPHTGESSEKLVANSRNENLSIPLIPFVWDLAFMVNKSREIL